MVGERCELVGCSGCVVRLGCKGVVMGRRSLDRERSLRRSCRRSGGVSVGGGMAVVCVGVSAVDKVGSTR